MSPIFTHTISIEPGGNSHFVFSGGEVHCKSKFDNLNYASVGIICRDYTPNGFMAVCMHNEIARRQGAAQVHLVLPYVPYARQDRVMQSNEPFSLRVFADLLNSQGFDSVKMFDPHSDVAPALIHNSVVVNQWEIAKKAIGKLVADECAVFVSPDAGAYKKLSKLIPDDSRIMVAAKVRGPGGKIERTRILNSDVLDGKTVVIVDDICDGGRTFIELAKELRRWIPEKIILYVTHGIFSQGFEELSQHIDAIVTTNSILHPTLPSFVTQQEIV